MKSNRFILFITIAVILCWNSQAFSLKEKTHQAINEHVAQNTVNQFSLNNYLINNLGLTSGDKEVLIGIDANGTSSKKRIFEWLGYGGFQEDRPGAWYDYLPWRSSRSYNHFHNPLKTNWDEAGLNDFGKTGQSSVLWAQNINQDPNHNLGGECVFGVRLTYLHLAISFGKMIHGKEGEDRI